jgi:hypothetical protein
LKHNGPAIRGACRQFIAPCRQLGLFAHAVAAIDGSKFKAVNNRDKNFTRAKMERRLAQIEESVARYLSQLDTADLQEPTEAGRGPAGSRSNLWFKATGGCRASCGAHAASLLQAVCLKPNLASGLFREWAAGRLALALRRLVGRHVGLRLVFVRLRFLIFLIASLSL